MNRFTPWIHGFIFGSVLCLIGAQTAGAQAITTGSPTPVGIVNFVNNSGNLARDLWGQTFQTPDASHNQLTSFTLFFSSGSVPINFQTYVMEWTGSDTVGLPLWVSNTEATPASLSFGGLQPIVFNTGALALDPTKQYLLVADATSVNVPGEILSGNIGYNDANASFTSGALVRGVGVGGANVDDLTWNTATWAPYDLAYSVTFQSAIPEPSTYAAFAGLGALGLVGWRHRRVRRVAQL